MNAVLWLRVSSEHQDIEKDRIALQGYAAGAGFEISGTYEVKGSAWTGEHRETLDRMLADADAGMFEAVLIPDLTRLSREGGDESLRIVKRIFNAGVEVRSLADPELGRELGFAERLGIMVKGELAHEDSNRKSLAVRRGMAKARQEKHIGRPKGAKDKKKRDSRPYKDESARRRLAREGFFKNE